MKKLIAAALAVLMVFALTACGLFDKSEPANQIGSGILQQGSSDKVEKYVAENKDVLISSMEASFASTSGMTCTSSIEVEGNGFIITIKINELEDIDEDTKAAMQSAYVSMQSTFDAALDTMQMEVPELEYYKVLVCEKDGDVLATIYAEG